MTGGFPFRRAADPAVVDSVEQHRELRRLELDRRRVRVQVRQPKAAALEALVLEDEPALVPGEDPRGRPEALLRALRVRDRELRSLRLAVPARELPYDGGDDEPKSGAAL